MHVESHLQRYITLIAIVSIDRTLFRYNCRLISATAHMILPRGGFISIERTQALINRG